MYLVLYKN